VAGGGAVPERFDGIGRHFLVIDVDAAVGVIGATRRARRLNRNVRGWGRRGALRSRRETRGGSLRARIAEKSAEMPPPRADGGGAPVGTALEESLPDN
jgi:hypothetical protein